MCSWMRKVKVEGDAGIIRLADGPEIMGVSRLRTRTIGAALPE